MEYGRKGLLARVLGFGAAAGLVVGHIHGCAPATPASPIIVITPGGGTFLDTNNQIGDNTTINGTPTPTPSPSPTVVVSPTPSPAQRRG